MAVDRQAFDPSAGIYKLSCVCGPQPQHSSTWTHTYTHTHTYTSKPEFAATEAPTHSNCSAYVVSCMTARSIKGLLNLFFQAVWDFHTTVTGMWGTFVVVIIFIHLKTMEKGKKEGGGGFPIHAYKSRWTGTVVVLPMGHALNFL